jgi:hypothetical protein
VTDTLDVDGTGALRHPWVVAGVVLAAALAVVTARAIVTVPRHRRRWVGLGLGIHVAGALGLEAVSGVVLDAAGDGLEYAAVTWAEEGAEMVGALVSRCALLGALDIRVRPCASLWRTHPGRPWPRLTAMRDPRVGASLGR